MSLAELVESVEFVVDAQGNRKAVVVDLAVWKEVLQILADTLEEAEDAQAIREIEVRITSGQERLFTHEEVWAEIEALESQGALPD
jgi:hypothetical protein